mmetsp:Transcript_3896/g.9073  ORF Transcript_3896/g.9073 Transcript_3896/m.9073 type:complete len:219 (-) Transcript_3896:59-715(-)
MLEHRLPDVLELSAYINRFSEHRSMAAYTIGNDSRFRLPRSASLPGPGAYRVDRDFPEGDKDEVRAQRLTPSYTIPEETRVTPNGIMKGMYTGLCTSDLGPGEYPLSRLGLRSKEKEFVTHTIPRSKESAEALRERKKKADVPGPGTNDVQRLFDSGREKQKATERAARRGTGCWAAAQYSHVFGRMKPMPISTGRGSSKVGWAPAKQVEPPPSLPAS